MIVDRYYYGRLSETEKAIYKELYSGCMQHKDVIPIPLKADANTDKVCKRVVSALTEDNPLLYFLNQSLMEIAQDANENIALVPQYFFSEDMVEQYNKKIQDSANQLIYDLKLTEGSELDKVRTVHDYMCNNIKYSHEGSDVNNINKMITTHNIMGVFADKEAQCEGIAKAAKVLLNAVDIRCICVGGKACTDKTTMIDHAWNIVNIDGNPYQLDITFDLGLSTPGYICYDYYNLSDSQMSKNHKFSTTLPKCSSKELGYFEQEQLIFKSKGKVLDYIDDQIAAGAETVYFKLAGKLVIADIIDELTDHANLFRRDEGIEEPHCKQIINEAMNTCRLKFC